MKALFRRVGKLLVFLVVLGLTAFGVLGPLFIGNPNPKSAAFEESPATITDFKASYRVSPEGLLTAVETVTVDMQPGQHGIFRYFPVADPTDPHARLSTKFKRAEIDGKYVPAKSELKNNRTMYVVKIGRENEVVSPGLHTYRLLYTVDGVLAQASAAAGDFTASVGRNTVPPRSAFYYNVVGFWTMKIRASQVTMYLPGPAGRVQCSAGAPECRISGAGPDLIMITTGALPAGNPVTVRVDLQVPPPPRAHIPWPIRYDRILGRSLPLVEFLVGLTGLLVVTITGVLLSGWQRRPAAPIMYAPPEGLGPAQCAYVATGRVSEHALVATLLYLADRKLVQLSGTRPDDWVITGIGTAEQWAAVDPVTRAVGRTLKIDTEGGVFRLDGTNSTRAVLSAARKQLPLKCDAWALREKVMSQNALLDLIISASGVAIFFGGVATLFVLLLLPTLVGVVPATLAIGGLAVVLVDPVRRRTRSGRQLWSRALGFRRLLATPSSEDRFDYAASRDLFIAYIPYAVAFGVADKWAAKYRMATSVEAPVPNWLPTADNGGGHRSSSVYTPGGFATFSSAVAMTVAAERAFSAGSSSGWTSSSSSSGPGGSSSWSSGGGRWGGGAGGGGGTW